MNNADKQVILLPKGAVTEGKDSRNPLVQLMVDAGYDKIRSGFDPKARNRNDQVIQGDFIFRAVKGVPALGAQFELFRGQSVGLVMGSDIVGDADLYARSIGVRADITQLLRLGIGPCSLQLLAPEAQSINEPSDVNGRLLFTKYPYILRRMLQIMNLNAGIRSTDGADTRLNEYLSEMPSRLTAALEIVGSGDTARANELQIVGDDIFPYPTGEAMGMPYLDVRNITTDLYMTNVSRIGERSRDMLLELGLALESARESNQCVAFTFNVPTDQIGRFADLGMKGPSVMKVLTRDGSEWSALQVYAPVSKKNSMRALLLRRGAKDLSSSTSLQVEIAADESEVFRALSINASVPEQEAAPDRNVEIADWLIALRDTVADRAANPKPGSSTTGALEKGTQFCAARFVGEIAELSKAVRYANRPEIILEAGQALYWLLVSMQSRGIPLEGVVNGIAGSGRTGNCSEQLAATLVVLRGAVETGNAAAMRETRSMLDQGVSTASMMITDQATEFSTAVCKQGDPEALKQAVEALRGIVCVVELAGVRMDEVMEGERAGS